ncbi:MAG: tRNA (guanine(46)-N(7))-methyltransferase TrmB [Pseudomonadota bacterium]
MSEPVRPPERRLFGRRRSHKLRPTRRALMAEFERRVALPGFEICWDPETGAPSRLPGAARPERGGLDLQEVFPRAQEVWLEIGFGGGEHLVHQAAAHREVGFIGCEHYVDGVAKLLSGLDAQKLSNVRVHPHDARDVLDACPDAALGRVFLLYPDPWPKRRHWKRRFVNADSLDALSRVMARGAQLRIASDIPSYISHCLAVLQSRRAGGQRDFRWTAERAEDWRRPWSDWPGTKYERKALEAGRTPCYLTFERTEHRV